jgi:hypothetical protein
MNFIEKILIRFGGFSPQVAAEFSQSSDRALSTKLGAAVLFSALIASLNWATAGWTFSGTQPENIRIGISVLAACLAFSLVAILDSSFLYFSDTTNTSWWKKPFYGLLRIAIILLISAITSQAVIPVLLRSELAAHALRLADQADGQRSQAYDAQFKVSNKEEVIRRTTETVEKLEEKARIIPADIAQRIKDAEQCWANCRSKKNTLILAGLTKEEAKKMVAAKAGACSREEKNAKNLLNSYQEEMRAELAFARQSRAKAVQDTQDVHETIKARMEAARAIETEALSPASASVLHSLLKSDRGAQIKYVLLTLLFLMLEILPLILKFICGRTPIGEEISSGRFIASKQRTLKVTRAEHDFVLSNALYEASSEASLQVLVSAEGKAIFARYFAGYMTALAPSQAVEAMMREIERQQLDINQFVRQHPRYATVITTAWSQAIRQTLEILQGREAASGASSL